MVLPCFLKIRPIFVLESHRFLARTLMYLFIMISLLMQIQCVNKPPVYPEIFCVDKLCEQRINNGLSMTTYPAPFPYILPLELNDKFDVFGISPKEDYYFAKVKDKKGLIKATRNARLNGEHRQKRLRYRLNYEIVNGSDIIYKSPITTNIDEENSDENTKSEEESKLRISSTTSTTTASISEETLRSVSSTVVKIDATQTVLSSSPLQTSTIPQDDTKVNDSLLLQLKSTIQLDEPSSLMPSIQEIEAMKTDYQKESPMNIAENLNIKKIPSLVASESVVESVSSLDKTEELKSVQSFQVEESKQKETATVAATLKEEISLEKSTNADFVKIEASEASSIISEIKSSVIFEESDKKTIDEKTEASKINIAPSTSVILEESKYQINQTLDESEKSNNASLDDLAKRKEPSTDLPTLKESINEEFVESSIKVPLPNVDTNTKTNVPNVQKDEQTSTPKSTTENKIEENLSFKTLNVDNVDELNAQTHNRDINLEEAKSEILSESIKPDTTNNISQIPLENIPKNDYPSNIPSDFTPETVTIPTNNEELQNPSSKQEDHLLKTDSLNNYSPEELPVVSKEVPEHGKPFTFIQSNEQASNIPTMESEGLKESFSAEAQVKKNPSYVPSQSLNNEIPKDDLKDNTKDNFQNVNNENSIHTKSSMYHSNGKETEKKFDTSRRIHDNGSKDINGDSSNEYQSSHVASPNRLEESFNEDLIRIHLKTQIDASTDDKLNSSEFVTFLRPALNIFVYLLPESVQQALHHYFGFSAHLFVFMYIVGTFWVILHGVELYFYCMTKEAAHKDELNSYQTKLFQLKKEIEKLRSLLKTEAEKFRTYEYQIKENDHNAAELKTALEKCKNEKDEWIHSFEELEEKLQLKKDQNFCLTEELKEVKKENTEIVNLNQNMKRDLAEVSENFKEAKKELDLSKLDLDQVKNQLDLVSDKITRLELENEELEKELEEALNKKDELEKDLEQAQSELKTMKNDLELKEGEIKNLKVIFSEMQKDQEDQEDLNNQEDKENEELVDEESSHQIHKRKDVNEIFEIVKIRLQLEQAEKENQRVREELESIRKENEDSKLILLELKEEKNSLKSESEKTAKEKKEAVDKLEMLQKYFNDREIQLQKELGIVQIKDQKLSEENKKVTEKLEQLTEEVNVYKSELEQAKQELVKNEKNWKAQIATQEKTAFDNWIASRNAERELAKLKRDAECLRQQLSLQGMKSASGEGHRASFESFPPPPPMPPMVMNWPENSTALSSGPNSLGNNMPPMPPFSGMMFDGSMPPMPPMIPPFQPIGRRSNTSSVSSIPPVHSGGNASFSPKPHIMRSPQVTYPGIEAQASSYNYQQVPQTQQINSNYNWNGMEDQSSGYNTISQQGDGCNSISPSSNSGPISMIGQTKAKSLETSAQYSNPLNHSSESTNNHSYNSSHAAYPNQVSQQQWNPTYAPNMFQNAPAHWTRPTDGSNEKQLQQNDSIQQNYSQQSPQDQLLQHQVPLHQQSYVQQQQQPYGYDVNASTTTMNSSNVQSNV